jgi:hypothetical protein
MFGMLDYRAHKLYWLLTLPLRIFARLLFLIAVAVGIGVGQWTEYAVWLKIIIAYLVMEGTGLLLMLLWQGLVAWPVNTIFFWLIDVIPTRGENEEEAREIVQKGRIAWLTKKLAFDIDNWTYKDTKDFVSALNWRAKWLFHAREKFDKRVAIFQQNFDDTGHQPGSLSQAEIKRLVGHLEPSWFEIMLVHPQFVNAVVGGCIIIIAIPYLSS